MDAKLLSELKELQVKNAAVHEENQNVITVLRDRMQALEQKGYLGNLDQRSGTGPSIYETVTKNDAFKQFQAGNLTTVRIPLPAGQLEQAQKAAIVNATGQGQPLVQAQRVGMVFEPQRRLFMRDLIPSVPTNSNLIEYTRENVFTNNAGVQATENTTKPESGITFTLATAPVVTMAHWIPVSKQVMDDSSALAAYLGPRMLYGLALATDSEILNGDGTAGRLSGILDAGNFTAYVRAVVGDTPIDAVGRAITQLALADYPCDGVVLSPADFETMRHEKDTQGRYLMGDPASALAPSLWGATVVVTNQIPAGTFLVGAFGMGAQIFNREQATVQMSREDGNNFVKNTITILAEERLALAIYRTKAFVSGTFA